MTTYLIKRFLSMIPFTLLAVLFVFGVFEPSWRSSMSGGRYGQQSGSYDREKIIETNCQTRSNLHLDWPVFYFSISPAALPADIREICNDQERALIKRLTMHNGNTEGARRLVARMKFVLKETPFFDALAKTESIDDLEDQLRKHAQLAEAFADYKSRTDLAGVFIPTFRFHGSENRFHAWMAGIIRFDFGRSHVDNQPATTRINKALGRTLVFTIPAILLIFATALFINRQVSKRSPGFRMLVSNVLYFFDAIPLFWLSVVFLIGSYSVGLGFNTISTSGSYLAYVLPVLVLILSYTPKVAKHVENSMDETSRRPFIVAARAKGLPETSVYSSHILPNASLPIITLFFNYLASAFAGAFVVEWVFSIDGIGRLMTYSVLTNDIPVMIGIILYFILITMILTLANDIVIYIINPKVKF